MESRHILMSMTLPEAVSKGRAQTLYSVTKEMYRVGPEDTNSSVVQGRPASSMHLSERVYRLQKEHLVQYIESISKNSKISSKMNYCFLL